MKFFLQRVSTILFKVEKRIRFAASALILGSLMLLSTFFFFDNVWVFVPLFVLISYLLVYASILEGIEKIEWVTLFLIPVLFTVSFYLFYFLFPVRWLTRLPFIILYTVSIYALLLTSNIFNVGVEKNLQLYRAAFSVNYFYHTVIAFLAFNILFSLRENFIINGIFAGVVTFPLALQLLWSIKLDLFLEQDLIKYSALLSFLVGQLAMIFSFVPFRSSIVALLLTAAYYSFSGLITAHRDDRLFPSTVREYTIVLSLVFVIALLTLNW